MAAQSQLRFLSIFTVVLILFQQTNATFPFFITEIELDLQISAPYFFILPTFARRRRSVDEHLITSEGQPSRESLGLTKLNSLFVGMGLAQSECQKRMLCLVSQNPTKYSPLTEVIFQHVDPRDNDYKFQFARTNETTETEMRFYELYEAGRKGFFPGTNCVRETLQCSTNPDNSIDWSKMKTYHLMKKFLNLSFK